MQLPLLLPTGQQAAINRNLFYDPGSIHGRPALIATPGLAPYTYSGCTVTPTGMVQGMRWISGVWLAVVINGRFYIFTLSGTALTKAEEFSVSSQLGTTDRVVFAVGDTGQLLVARHAQGGDLFRYNAGALATVSAPAEGLLVYQDRMFISASINTSDTIYPSNVSSYLWTDFDPAYASGYSDWLLELVSHKRYIYALGGFSVEVFYNTGSATAPLERVQGGTIPVGCGAKDAVVTLGDNLIWLTQTGKVARLTGTGSYDIISTPQLEAEWGDFTDYKDAYAIGVRYAGHEWYVVTFPTSNKTYVYDDTTAQAGLFPWFEWGRSSSGEIDLRSAEISQSWLTGKPTTFLGDSSNGKIYYLSGSTYTNNGSAFTTTWYPPAIREDRRNIQHNCFEVEIKEGTGAATSGQVLKYSDDRQRTWTTPTAISGVNADYDQLFRWYQLGSSRERQYKYECATSIQRAIYGANLTAGIGTP